MNLRSRHIFSLFAVSLTAAVSASMLTAWIFTQPEPSAAAPLTEQTTLPTTAETTIKTAPPTFPTTRSTTTTEPVATLIDPAILSEQAKEQLALLTNGQLIQALYERIAPSVVGISVLAGSEGLTTPLSDSGSGVIYSAKGLILTSADLFAVALNRYGELIDKTQILVRVDGASQPFEATYVGRDRLTGVAVLSIEPGSTRLQPAVFASNPTLKVGQHVFFASYREDLIEQGSLTSGIINAVHQPIQLEDGTTVEMIRSDAPILNNGSGGPLINIGGEVIALSNSSQLSDSYESLSYAIPAGTALLVADNLVNQGYIDGRAWLGIAVLKDESFAELQDLYHFPDGLYISHVIPDSPAYIADLRRGDIITAINGDAITQHQNLASILNQHKAGDQLTLAIYRRSDGKEYERIAYLKEYVE